MVIPDRSMDSPPRREPPFPDLSVAISTMERPEPLERCLGALAVGTLLPAEVVLVDQSRDDHTARLVESFRTGPLRVRLLRQPPLGLGASQNEAVSQAATTVVAVTDDDCVPARNWVERLSRIFASADSPDLVTGRVLALPASGDRTYPVSLRTSGEARAFDRASMPWDVGSGNNFAVRRSAFLEIGGCDERLGPGSAARGGVDMDLFYRFLRSGARVRYDPTVLVEHERETLAGRRSRRPMYGRGMGACVAFRLRDGDRHALRLLSRWLLLRARLAARAIRRLDGRGVYEEWLMLNGTAAGLLHGWRAGRAATGLRPLRR
jgi:GT2 family glycosyltransferase